MNLEIDNRESGERRNKCQAFFSDVGVKTSIKKLPVGDYIFDGKVAFEYKTSEDYINSVIDGRIFKQAKRISQYPFHAIVLVGDIDEAIAVRYIKKTNGRVFTINNYLGAMATLSEKTRVIRVKTEHQAFQIMYYIAENFINKNKNVRGIDKAICKMTDPIATFLNCIDDVGIYKAALITNHLKLETLQDLVAVEYDDLISIKGIGDKTAKKIINVIK